MSLLEVKDLSVCYGEQNIVDKVSFSLREGQWLMIAGPNGAGKSTIVSAIAQGAPYTGQILFEGRDVKHYKPHALARNIGVLAQSHFVSYSFKF